MKLVIAYFKTSLLELVRIPAFAVPTLIFPSLLFLFFGVPNGKEPQTASFLMASYTVFAILGIALFQFGVNIAEDRTNPWEAFLRILPVAPLTRFAARVLAALAFALVAGGLVVLMALLFTSARLTAAQWFMFGFALLMGSIPFTLFGIAIGYLCSPKAALPVANLLYLLLAFAGGLWFPPSMLPGPVAAISPFLPTRQYGDVVWSVVTGQPWQFTSWLGLLCYALFFGLLATWAYRRDEGQRYR